MKSDARPRQADHQLDEETVRSASPRRLLIAAVLVVLVCAAVVLLILSFLPPMTTLVKALVGGLLTAALAAPLLYLTLFRPVLQQVQIRQQAEQELESMHRRLKALVAERTESLAQTNRRLTHEVDEQRRAAESLRRHNDFVEAVVARAPCLILTFDTESHRCGHAGDRITELLGYRPGELTAAGDSLVERLVVASDRASFRRGIKELVDGPEGQVVVGRCGFVAASGRVIELRYGMTVLSRTPTMEARDLLLTALPASV